MPLDFQIPLIQQYLQRDAALHSNWDEYTIAPWTGRVYSVKRLSWGLGMMGRLAAYKMLSKAS